MDSTLQKIRSCPAQLLGSDNCISTNTTSNTFCYEQSVSEAYESILNMILRSINHLDLSVCLVWDTSEWSLSTYWKKILLYRWAIQACQNHTVHLVKCLVVGNTPHVVQAQEQNHKPSVYCAETGSMRFGQARAEEWEIIEGIKVWFCYIWSIINQVKVTASLGHFNHCINHQFVSSGLESSTTNTSDLSLDSEAAEWTASLYGKTWTIICNVSDCVCGLLGHVCS